MDKRQTQRVILDCDTKAILSCHGKTIIGMIENVSPKGMFIKTDEMIPTDENVKIRINLMQGLQKESIDMNGVVVWSDKAGMGIQFMTTFLLPFWDDSDDIEREFIEINTYSSIGHEDDYLDELI